MAKARLESWVVSDAFWERVEPLIPPRPGRPARRKFARQPGGGRKPKEARVVFEAIVYVLRTGCQWKALPRERFGSASAIHKRFLEWAKAGFLSRCGKRDWPSATRWRGSLGDGKASTEPY